MATAAAILEAINIAIGIANQLSSIGQKAAPVWDLVSKAFFGKTEITEEEIAAFRSDTDALRAKFHLPLPSKEEGEEN